MAAAHAAASNQELTEQGIALFNWMNSAEAEVIRQRTEIERLERLVVARGGDNGNSGVMDKKRLHPREFKKGGNFRRWSERFSEWIALAAQRSPSS